MSLIATSLLLTPASDQCSGQGPLTGFIHRLFWFPPGKRSQDEVGIGGDGKQSSLTPGHLWVRRGRRHRGVKRHAPLGVLGGILQGPLIHMAPGPRGRNGRRSVDPGLPE